MQTTTIAVDIAKSVFEIAVSTRAGRVKDRARLSRPQFLRFFAERKPALVVLEACGSAHHWARELQKLGHQTRLLPPRETRPYVTRNKTDRSDCQALLEASRNEKIRPVPVKSISQQSLTALHRLRSAWMFARTARINTVRGLLRELGHFIPVGSRQVVPAVEALVENPDAALPTALRGPLVLACQEIRELEERIHTLELELEQLARQMPVVARLRTIPGVGLLTATALVAFVGDIRRFPSARHFASYLGLTPSERSSGLRRRLGAISKRGDVYLRMLLTHGARSVLSHAVRRTAIDSVRTWAVRIRKLRGYNKATIALANKLARIVWAVWKKGGHYAPPEVPA